MFRAHVHLISLSQQFCLSAQKGSARTEHEACRSSVRTTLWRLTRTTTIGPGLKQQNLQHHGRNVFPQNEKNEPNR